MTTGVTITTEDGIQLHEGDAAYDYYNMKPGKIGSMSNTFNDTEDPWFDFKHDDGTSCLLNGARICSVRFARMRKFKDA